MTIIDVHTHTLSRDYLARLAAAGDGYRLGRDIAGTEAIFHGDTAFATLTPEMFGYEQRIADMDAEGVDVSIVSLTAPSVYWGGEATSLAAAVAMNDDMAAAQTRYPGRIRFLATLPWQYPDAAVGELRRAVAAGAVGVMVLANIEGRTLTDPLFAPVWAAIDELALPVLVHPTAPPALDALPLERYHLVWSVGFTFDTTMAVARMLLDGFFERYGRLKIIASHGGGALPFLMPRLDQGHRQFESARVAIDRLPSEYLDRVYADAVVYSRDALDSVLRVFGPDNVLFGTDYPHRCSIVRDQVELVGSLPRGERTRVESGNAERIFELG